jgi:hypothetical protein
MKVTPPFAIITHQRPEDVSSDAMIEQCLIGGEILYVYYSLQGGSFTLWLDYKTHLGMSAVVRKLQYPVTLAYVISNARVSENPSCGCPGNQPNKTKRRCVSRQ